MKSMTGYGYAEFQDEKNQLIVEIKSYNNRYLDVLINLPPFLSPLEAEIRKYFINRANRGRIEVFIKVRELEENVVFHLDKGLALSYSESLKELSTIVGLDEEISLSNLLKFDGIIKEEKQRDIDEYSIKLFKLLEEAFTQWENTRIKEGKETLQDIFNNLNIIQASFELFKTKSVEMEANIRTNIKSRFKEVLGDEIAENRFLAETAVLLVKYSINEEIARIIGHVYSFIKTTESEGAVGKKLDFICQELNREINTIGSKSCISEVSDMVIEAKNSIENIREQLRNVE